MAVSVDQWDVAVEIGGTKLQWGAGRPGEPWVELERRMVVPEDGAAGILRQLETGIGRLKERFALRRVGVGFGGPVDRASGRVLKSHQIAGWEAFPLADWFAERLELPAVIANDCDTAALGEALLGAGRGRSSVFYVTVGSGIGGGFVLDGKIYGAARPAVAEIGHLRPGPKAVDTTQTVESIASGWGLARQAQAKLAHPEIAHTSVDLDDLRLRCGGREKDLDTKMIGEAAAAGNRLAVGLVAEAVTVLGWAIGQTMTLLAPEIVVVGGGVSMMPESIFWVPLQKQVRRFVFPPLGDSCEMARAALGEQVVLHGGLLLAAGDERDRLKSDRLEGDH